MEIESNSARLDLWPSASTGGLVNCWTPLALSAASQRCHPKRRSHPSHHRGTWSEPSPGGHCHRGQRPTRHGQPATRREKRARETNPPRPASKNHATWSLPPRERLSRRWMRSLLRTVLLKPTCCFSTDSISQQASSVTRR